jgi:hypothetical protein
VCVCVNQKLISPKQHQKRSCFPTCPRIINNERITTLHACINTDDNGRFWLNCCKIFSPDQSSERFTFTRRSTMTMKSMKYQECDTIMDNYNPVPPPLPRRVQPVRNIYAEPFETNTSRWVRESLYVFEELSHCQPIIIILNSLKLNHS